MSDDLKTFLSAYLDWVDDGAPDGAPFIRMWGLCSNLRHWSLKNNRSVYQINYELRDEFFGDGMNKDFPFGTVAYERDKLEKTMHLDPARIKWVRSKVAEFEIA